MFLIGNKWKIFVLRELLDGTKRFNELQRAIASISQKVLTQNLRAMEKDGLITRKVYAEVPPRVEYRLSDLGDSLRPVIDVLWRWGRQYQKLKGAGFADVESREITANRCLCVIARKGKG